MYTPRFTITPQINSQIAQIERFRLLVEKSRILPTKEVVLRRRAAIEATRSSTGIEGNPLNIAEVERVLSGEKVSASDRFITEITNYKKSLEAIEHIADHDKQFLLRDILALHALVTRGLLPASKTGTFRKTPIYVVDFVDDKEVVRYEGPKAELVRPLVEELLAWLYDKKNESLHPLLKAGMLHYEFVSIHPFADGNGRVTRLLTLLYLYQSGYGFRRMLVPDSYYFENRPRYYAALGQGKTYKKQRSADVTPWLTYFINGIHTVAHDLKEKIMSVSILDSQKEPLTMTPEDYEIIEFISIIGKASIDDVVAAVKITKRTAQRRLARLVRAELLGIQGKGRATVYLMKKL